jgi:thioredoxin
MIILRNILIFCTLYILNTLNVHGQDVDKKSKYIQPIIESDSVFYSVIRSQEYVVVDFWAVWCRPCQLFLPEYEEIAKKFYKKASFFKLNIEQCPDTTEEYDVKMIPVIIIFKKGKEVKRYVGLTDKARITFDLEEIIKANY